MNAAQRMTGMTMYCPGTSSVGRGRQPAVWGNNSTGAGPAQALGSTRAHLGSANRQLWACWLLLPLVPFCVMLLSVLHHVLHEVVRITATEGHSDRRLSHGLSLQPGGGRGQGRVGYRTVYQYAE